MSGHPCCSFQACRQGCSHRLSCLQLDRALHNLLVRTEPNSPRADAATAGSELRGPSVTAAGAAAGDRSSRDAAAGLSQAAAQSEAAPSEGQSAGAVSGAAPSAPPLMALGMPVLPFWGQGLPGSLGLPQPGWPHHPGMAQAAPGQGPQGQAAPGGASQAAGQGEVAPAAAAAAASQEPPPPVQHGSPPAAGGSLVADSSAALQGDSAGQAVAAQGRLAHGRAASAAELPAAGQLPAAGVWGCLFACHAPQPPCLLLCRQPRRERPRASPGLGAPRLRQGGLWYCC